MIVVVIVAVPAVFAVIVPFDATDAAVDLLLLYLMDATLILAAANFSSNPSG